VNPWTSNQPRIAALIRPRATSSGRRSAWRSGLHQGEGAAFDKLDLQASATRRRLAIFRQSL
jgi:hypothetical protein